MMCLECYFIALVVRKFSDIYFRISNCQHEVVYQILVVEDAWLKQVGANAQRVFRVGEYEGILSVNHGHVFVIEQTVGGAEDVHGTQRTFVSFFSICLVYGI